MVDGVGGGGEDGSGSSGSSYSSASNATDRAVKNDAADLLDTTVYIDTAANEELAAANTEIEDLRSAIHTLTLRRDQSEQEISVWKSELRTSQADCIRVKEEMNVVKYKLQEVEAQQVEKDANAILQLDYLGRDTIVHTVVGPMDKEIEIATLQQELQVCGVKGI